MTQSNCPFSKWLGLTSSDPDHFELLDVSPNETDADRIKLAAKAVLKKLGPQPTDAEKLVSWKTVRRRIKLAFRCLTNDAERTAYMGELLVKARQAPETASEPAPLNHRTDRELETVSDQLREEVANETPASRTESETDDIPTAIPIAEIVEVQPESAPRIPKVSPPVVVTESRKRQHGNSLLPMILVAAIAGGSGFAAYQFLFNKPRNSDSNNSQFDSEPTVLLPTIDTGNPPKVDSNNQKGQGNLSENGKTKRRKPGTTKPPAGESSKQSSKQPRSENQIPSTLGPEGSNDSAETPPGITLGTPNVTDHLGFYHHSEEALLEMRRCNWPMMLHHMQIAKRFTMSEDMVRIWERQSEVGSRYQDFWQRVTEKARDLPAMSDLKIGDAIISITEAKPTELVYRFQGQRIANEYTRLPELIALAIASHGQESNSPLPEQVHMDRSLVLAVAARANAKHREKAVDFIEQASADGHSTFSLRRFIDDSPESLYQPKTLPPLTKWELKERGLTPRLEVRHPELNLEVEDQETLLENIHQIRQLAIASELEASYDTVIFVNRGIELAQKANNPDLLVEFMNLKDRRAKAGSKPASPDLQLARMAGKNQSRQTAKALLVHFVELLKSQIAQDQQDAAQQSLNVIRELANKYELSKELSRIERIYGDFNSRKTGRLGI